MLRHISQEFDRLGLISNWFSMLPHKTLHVFYMLNTRFWTGRNQRLYCPEAQLALQEVCKLGSFQGNDTPF